MSKDPLSEMQQFLQLDSRLDLKHISLDHLVGISATETGIDKLLQSEQILQAVIELTDDKVEQIAQNALLLLVNVSAKTNGATELLKYKPSKYKNILELLISYVLDPLKSDADAACMILSNITRLEDELEVCLDTFLPYLNDLLNAFIVVDYNKKGSNLHYLAPMFSNLSCIYRIRKWLIEENPHVPLIKLLPFCNYEPSVIRRGGALGTVRNLSFDPECHKLLMSTEIDLLSYLLLPVMGNEEYCDEEMDRLPLNLQYLPKDKRRDPDVDIRRMVMETLIKLCTKSEGRQFLRDNGVYYVLREYHKWEKDPITLYACENVVDILIQNEDEVGADDLSAVEVPDEMKEKFEKMDKEYLKSLEKENSTQGSLT